MKYAVRRVPASCHGSQPIAKLHALGNRQTQRGVTDLHVVRLDRQPQSRLRLVGFAVHDDGLYFHVRRERVACDVPGIDPCDAFASRKPDAAVGAGND